MIRILRILNRFNLGGPTYNAGYLTVYLPPYYKTLLIGGTPSKYEECSAFILENLKAKFITIPEMQRDISPIKDIISYYKILKIIDKFKPHIIHTHASKAGLLGRIAAIRKKVPIIVHTFHGHVFHSYFNQPLTHVFKNIEKSLAKKTSAIIAVSDYQKKELVEIHKIAPIDKVFVIYNGFDLEKFKENNPSKKIYLKQKFGVSPDDILISIIGRLVPIKNHKLFIKSFAHVKNKSTKKIKALIVGDGKLKKNLIKLCFNLNLKATEKLDEQNFDIKFTGWVKNIEEIYFASDIIALTSLNEGTPVTLIEAQAANVPIITTKVGGISDIVIENKTALLCNTNDLQDFSDKLLLLVENENLRNQFLNYPKNFIFEKFSYKRLINEYDKLYLNLLKKKGFNLNNLLKIHT